MSKISAQTWGDYIAQFPNSHILQSAPWGELKSQFGWEFVRLKTEQAGVQVLFKSLRLGFSWAYVPKGPLGRNWEQLWPLLDAECRRRKAVFLKVEPHVWDEPTDAAEMWLPPTGFRRSTHEIQPPRTLLVSLSGSEEEILARMKQKTRYNIRLAARKGVTVRTSSDLTSFHQLMELTSTRETFSVHSQDYYQSAYDLFAPQGKCELFFAEYEDELLAALMVFASGKTAWYFYGASSNQNRNLMAPYAVQWAAMQWARNQGCLEYDLWGVPDADIETLEAGLTHRRDGLWGVYRFKRGFGGQLKRGIGAWDRVYNPILYGMYQLWLKKTQS
jgi:peptidoglycan pentaglycine glycine transferase (the first glycine)